MKPLVLIAPLLATVLTAGCATSSNPTSATPATPATSTAAGQAAAGDGVQAGGPTAARRKAAAPDQAGARDGDDDDAALPRVELTREVMFQVLAAEVAAQNGQFAPAVATYMSLAQNLRDPRLARRATELSLTERSLDHAMRAAQLWYELAPQSTQAAQSIEALWLATGRFTEVEPLLRQRLAQARTAGQVPEVYGQLARQLIRTNDRPGALALLERVSEPDQTVPEAHLAIATVAAASGENERSAAEAEKAIALRPDDERTAVVAAQLIQPGPDGHARAARLLEAFLKRQPTALEARFTYARMLAADKKTEAASEQMAMALQQDPQNPAVLLSMAQLAYQLKQPQVAEGHLRRYLDLPPSIQRDNATAWLFLGQIAEDEKRYDDADRWLAQITSGDQYVPALVRRALIKAKAGKVEAGRELLRTATVSSPRERVQLISAEAQLLREAGRNKAAFDLLNQALERQPENPDLLYDQAMAAERIGRVDILEGSLRKLITLRPDFAHAYNALGYTFADRNIRLEEAEQLIDKALTLAPDDPHIMDSLGWVYYRRGRLAESVDVLRRAYAIRPEPDIAAHLGEVLWKSGKHQEAREMWEAARKADPANETLKETLARLNIAL